MTVIKRLSGAARFSGLLACLVVPAITLPAQTRDWDAQARALVAQMTLPEKIQELHGIQDYGLYRYVPPVPRLHIPALHVANGPAGVGPAGDRPQLPATALPAPISLAASWDTNLAYQYGVLMGQESKDLDEDLLEAPDINIARVPQNGRTFEAFGEDPWLVSRLGVGVIEGVQSQQVIANVKHYLANNQESDRMKVNVIVDERTLREIYLPAFAAAVKEAHVASLMGAYNKVNGTFNCENPETLDRILKQEWGFQGFVTSDFGAVHSTVPSALAGLDLEMPTGKYFGTALETAVASNQVPMSVIDDKLIRRFRTMMAYGMFDHPDQVPARTPIPAATDGAQARVMAEAGMVLLKNDGHELPLDATKLHRIAVVGPYAAKAMTGGGGSSHVVPLYTVDPVAGIRQRAGTGVEVDFADGANLDEAVALAKTADVAIVMVGEHETEGHDHSLNLSGNQDDLVAAVVAANPHTVVVLKTGSVVFMPWVAKVPALLEAWYPGEEDGNSVAAVLFGDVNPSGKLPITFPAQTADLPIQSPEQYPGVDGTAHYTDGVFVGYRAYDQQQVKPLFPFGFGLSYTTFAFDHLTVSAANLTTDPDLTQTVAVDLDVTNTGKKAGQEVVQVYLGLPSTRTVPQPPAQLKAFQKVALAPGETRRVHLELNPHAFAYWDITTHGWKIMPGHYRVMAGDSSRNLPLESSLTIPESK